MTSKKHFLLPLFTLLIIISTIACSSTDVNSRGEIIRNQAGTLRWAGSPAVDGAGMLFVVGKKEYGAPGIPDDYPYLFGKDQYEVEIRADFKITGEDAVRGWGAKFPAIEFIKIEKI